MADKLKRIIIPGIMDAEIESGSGAGIQPNWNQTDSTANDYIKNKPDIYTKTEINQKLVGAMTYKGIKATVSELPNSGNILGDIWHVNADGSEWAWNGSSWEELGSNNSGASEEIIKIIIADNGSLPEEYPTISSIINEIQAGKNVEFYWWPDDQWLENEDYIILYPSDITFSYGNLELTGKNSDTGQNVFMKGRSSDTEFQIHLTNKVENAVLYTAQTLTDAQKVQARENIGAYSKPTAGIPASDLAAGVIPDISGKANAADVYTKTEIDQKLVGAMDYKGTKATVSALPTSGNETGDVWHITADGSEWAWNGSAWEELGSAVDLSGYRTASAQDAIDSAQDTAIAAKYTKPSGGIPDSDIASAATWNAKGTYSKPSGGIPKNDLVSDVQSSLGKADTALQDGANITNNLGFCYVNVGAGQTATELVGTNANYVPKNGGIVVGRFLVDVPSNATINISGKGAKAVYFRNSAITAGVIKSGDVAAFVYYPERYYLISLDRWQTDIEAIWNAGYQTASDVQDSIEDYISEHDITGEDSRLDSLATFSQGEETVIPLFTNQLPISTDTDGTIFHGMGYHEGYRFNSSGEEVELAGVSTTGFIPATRANVLRFQDIGVYAEAATGVTLNRIYLCSYDASKAFLNAAQVYKVCEHTPAAATVTDGRVVMLDLSATDPAAYGVPEGTGYVRFSAYAVTDASVITVDEEIAYDEHGEITSVALKPDVGIPQLAPLDERITVLENNSDTVDSTDPLFKYADQIDKGLTVGYEPTLTNRPTADLVAKKYLNFLHISDTHGSVNAENAVKILNKLKANGRCSFLIHTGDFHSSTFADVASWNTFAGYIAQANAPVLLVSGNHDVGNNSQSTTDGTTATDAQLYTRCFDPYVSGWNLTSHPTGKCYWYKDFADEGVRLIGLYDFESDYATDSTTGDLLYKRGYAAYHQAQIDWFVQALLTCPSGYGVVIAKHNPMNKRGTLDNPFNGEFLQGQNTAQSYVSKDMIAEIVQAFMDGTTINKSFAQTGNVTDTLTVNQSFASKNTGAHFVCYLDGHTHADGVNFLQDFPKQLELNIGCDNYHYQHYSDTYNQNGTLHQDLLNYVSVDVNRGYVYIRRIGNDYTAQADRRDFTAIDYKNPPVVVDFPEVDASDDGKVWGVSGGQYGLIASPAPTESVLEPIRTYTCDGTETTTSAFFIAEDDDGNAFRLKKLVMRVTLGTVTDSGTFSANALSGSKIIAQAYSSYGASASGQKYLLDSRQDGGYWRMEQFGFSSVTGNIGFNHEYSFLATVYDYPYIDRIRLTRAVPAGTVIELLGVRA